MLMTQPGRRDGLKWHLFPGIMLARRSRVSRFQSEYVHYLNYPNEVVCLAIMYKMHNVYFGCFGINLDGQAIFNLKEQG